MNKDIHDVLEEHERDKDNLIPLLQGTQEKLGYISQEAVKEISIYLDLSEAEIYGVATFYTQFRFTRPGDHIMRVCRGTACHVRGGRRIMNEVSNYLGIKPGETTPNYKFSLDRVACFGSCALSPVVVVDDKVYGRMTPQKVKELLKEIE
ncbi:MAG: NADH-quinone oxidoreductase subunit NuoE [Thermodesulfobacteriota bacterium]|nr:NADH-quinone oxidoreductase subunit NuoE [Thermodesulfobacteriota bacterium]